ncbi:MAG: hypothetical protein LBS05_05850 [Tannerellaceae bacterium]|jgi:hypothetical protein|nr:hypothetical protein [Tannerellaceae bacterium]
MKRLKRLNGWYVCWLLLLTAACSTEETLLDPTTRSGSDVTIRITFPEAVQTTRAITATDENKVTHVDLLVFTDDGNTNFLDDKFAYKIAVNSGITGTGAEKSFTVPLENMTSARQRIVLLANLPAALRTTVIDVLDDSDVGVTTMKSIIGQLRYTGAPWRTALTSGNFTAFPMFGQMFEYKQIDHDHQITTPIDINMIRSVAKIDVGVDIGGSAQGFGTVFSINKIYLCNASDSGYVAPHDDYIRQTPEQTLIGKTNVAATRTGDIEYTFPSGRDFFNSIYVPETDSLIVVGTDSIKPAYLVVDAQYKGVQRFYRIDFTKDAKYVPLLRNHKYVVNILGIRADGYATLAEAKNAPLTTLNFEVILDGNSNINDISAYTIGDQLQYILGVSVNELIFDWENNWIGKPATGGSAYYTVRVFSTYNNGEWAVEYTPSGLTATKQSATELRISSNNTNHTGVERPALLNDSVRIRAGFLTKGISVRQTGGANSVVAKFANGATTATVRLPLGLVNAARPYAFSGKTIDAFGDSILWQESGTGVTFTASLSNGTPAWQQYITVTATVPNAAANKYANAVVALTWESAGDVGSVGSEEPRDVVWSWHIWTMPENFETTYTSGGDVNADFHNPNQGLLMKRVLGKGAASHLGLFYQWGRKDPFTRSLDGITPAIFHDTPVVVADNLANAIRLPSTFYRGTSASDYDWYGTTHNNTLWSDSPEPGTKTFYDPCPEGWRVPPHYTDPALSPWANETNLVRAEYANGYIPFVGVAVGSGYLWTASVHDNITSRWVAIPSSPGSPISHTNSLGRAGGLSVRCVKDLKRKY